MVDLLWIFQGFKVLEAYPCGVPVTLRTVTTSKAPPLLVQIRHKPTAPNP